jgi:esterase/lipase superfamily enzyme
VTGGWYSERLQQPIGLARWGHSGTPVLVFPTADGDAEEIERNGLVGACWPLIEEGRGMVCSCDSVAGRALLRREGSPQHRMWLLDRFHQCVVWLRMLPQYLDELS